MCSRRFSKYSVLIIPGEAKRPFMLRQLIIISYIESILS